MHVLNTQRMFPWEALEDCPSLKTIRQMLQALPDAKLLEALRRRRGRGRNQYPVHILWGVQLLTVACRHVTTQACLDELHRNPSLRQIIGIEHEWQIPNKWNMSRFQAVLGAPEIYPLMREVFDELISQLGACVPELGKHTAGDSCHLHGRPGRAADPDRGPAAGDGTEMFEAEGSPAPPVEAQEPAAPLPQPTGGRKEYKDDEGKVTKVLEWFGYKLHLLVDQKTEVTLSWDITSANAPDNHTIPALLEQARRNLPEGRIETLAYDKAADDSAVHRALSEAGVKPVIQITSHWEDEAERMLPGHDGTSNIVYDEAGTIWCYDKTSEPPVKRQMYYNGYEAARGTLKYRCPVAVYEGSCAHAHVCNRERSYGKTVRVDCQIDLRRFPPIPRATKKFEKLYKGRTTVERVNARLKVFWGADDGNVTGAERFHGHVATIMIVHAVMATLLASAPRHDGTLGQTRLLPVAQALHKTWGG